MVAALWEFPIALPRHAFSARDAARAADLWRAFQEAAVTASSNAGWTPRRFAQAGTAFVVRRMTVRHHRETYYGESLAARTWVCRFRRDMISSREVRIHATGDKSDLVASATQEWVHIDLNRRTPVRAPESVTEAFPEHVEGEAVALPDYGSRPVSGRHETIHLRPFYVAMDPLNHVNHPDYVDWCDEVVSRVLAEAGIDPLALSPVAEEVVFRSGVNAREETRVETRPIGLTAEGHLALRHRIRKGDERAADATTVRRLHGVDVSELERAFALVRDA